MGLVLLFVLFYKMKTQDATVMGRLPDISRPWWMHVVDQILVIFSF